MSFAVELPPPELLIRASTLLTLTGLLLAVGLRLELATVLRAIAVSRLGLILPLNFILVPAVAVALVQGFALPGATAAGMLLLAAAPFAPVVPVFVKLARGDLALAAGLTAIFPLFAAFLTPLVCDLVLPGITGTPVAIHFDPLRVFGTLSTTVTLPILGGMLLRHRLPRLAARLLRPLEIVAETTGALSLLYISYVEVGPILATGWQPLLAMVLAGEISFLLGLGCGGPDPSARQTIAFGTANRNIALALLVAVDSFSGTAVLGAVVTNGLLLIFLGLLHVGGIRLNNWRRRAWSRVQGESP